MQLLPTVASYKYVCLLDIHWTLPSSPSTYFFHVCRDLCAVFCRPHRLTFAQTDKISIQQFIFNPVSRSFLNCSWHLVAVQMLQFLETIKQSCFLFFLVTSFLSLFLSFYFYFFVPVHKIFYLSGTANVLLGPNGLSSLTSVSFCSVTV